MLAELEVVDEEIEQDDRAQKYDKQIDEIIQKLKAKKSIQSVNKDVAVAKLHHNYTMRPLNKPFVDNLKENMKNNLFDWNNYTITVIKHRSYTGKQPIYFLLTAFKIYISL